MHGIYHVESNHVFKFGFSVQLSNVSILRGKGFNIKLHLDLSKIELLVFFYMMNLTVYF